MGIFDRAKDTAATKRDPGDEGHGGLDRSGLDRSAAEQGGRPAEAEVARESAGTERDDAEGQEPSQPAG